MKQRTASLISLVAIACLAGLMMMDGIASDAKVMNMTTLGPGYFPVRVSVIVIVLCAISVYRVIRSKNDEKMDVGNLRMGVYTMAITVAFMLVWWKMKIFYVPATVLLMALTTLYTPNLTRETMPKRLTFNAIYSVCMMGFIYVAFEHFMNIRF